MTSKEQLPAWDLCRARVEDGTASALERFIYENEPSYVGGVDLFRQLLAEVVTKAYEPISPGTNRQPVSNPMRDVLYALADAAEELASGPPDMPSNKETCQRFDDALAAARSVLATPVDPPGIDPEDPDEILLDFALQYDQGPGNTYEFDRSTLLRMLRKAVGAKRPAVEPPAHRDAPRLAGDGPGVPCTPKKARDLQRMVDKEPPPFESGIDGAGSGPSPKY